MKTKPVIFQVLALFGMTITGDHQGPSGNPSCPRLHKARLLALQSKLERMGCGQIILNTEASLDSASSQMTADVAMLSVPQVQISYDLCESQHCAQVSPFDCTLCTCTVKTCNVSNADMCCDMQFQGFCFCPFDKICIVFWCAGVHIWHTCHQMMCRPEYSRDAKLRIVCVCRNISGVLPCQRLHRALLRSMLS